MVPRIRNAVGSAAVVLLFSALLGVSGALAQGLPKLVAKPYPGAIPELIKGGKTSHTTEGYEHHTAYSFLTHDSVEQVKAFYAKEGIALGVIPVGKDQNAPDDGLYDLGSAAALQLNRESIGALLAGPVEYWETKSAADEPSYFNTVIVIAARLRPALQGDAKANEAGIRDSRIMTSVLLTPETAALMKDSPSLAVEAAQLVPLYNQHLALVSGFFQSVDGETVAAARLAAINQRRTLQWAGLDSASQSGQSDDNADKKAALNKELRAILARKPDKRQEVGLLRVEILKQRQAKDLAGMKASEAKLDKVYRSDPELAAWKARSDSLEQGKKAGRQQDDRNEQARKDALTNPAGKLAAVKEYLAGLDKDAYPTRILIQLAGKGRDFKRDPATVRTAWNNAFSFLGAARPAAGAKPAASAAPAKSAPAAAAAPARKPENAEPGSAAKKALDALNLFKKKS